MNKMFRVSRIEEVLLQNENWMYEEKHQHAYLDIFRMSSTNGITYPIKLELNTRAHNLLLEEFPLSEKYLTKICKDKWLLETEVSSYAGVGRFVMGLAADIRIIDTPGLKKYIADYVQQHILQE